jgi:transposase
LLLLVDGRGIPLAWTLTGGNRNDITQLIPLVERVPPVRGKVGRPRRRRASLIADRGYDHDKYRRLVWKRGVKPIIAWLHNRRRLLIRTNRRDDIHEGFLALACCLICWRRLEASFS